MALLNTGCLISTIQTDVTGITTGYAADCFTVIAAGVDGATQDRCVTVPTSGSLPSLWPTQTVPQGQVVFVEDVGVPVIAANGKWIGFDQRIFRSDLPKGDLYTWGYNLQGQLGDGTTTARSSPGTVVGGGTTWCVLRSGATFTVAIKTDGTLWTWGGNSVGQLGTNDNTSRSSPGTTAGGGNTWCAASGGQSFAAAIKTDGTLWAWGNNSSGQLGDGTITSRRSPVTTAGGGNTWCVVSGGLSFAAAIKTDGTLWTWGFNRCGQLGDGSVASRSSPGTVAGGGANWCAVSTGLEYTAAIKTDGTLWTWGCNGYGILGTGDTTSRSSPGTTAGGGTTWCAVSAGYYHAAAVKTDGTLWTWGFNGSGGLGSGTTTSRSSPGTVAGGGTTWCGISSGDANSGAIKTDGTLWTWGCNTTGQLGDGTTTARCSPGTVAGGGTSWFTVFAGRRRTGAIKTS